MVDAGLDEAAVGGRKNDAESLVASDILLLLIVNIMEVKYFTFFLVGG